jgi:hypothetical protein
MLCGLSSKVFACSRRRDGCPYLSSSIAVSLQKVLPKTLLSSMKTPERQDDNKTPGPASKFIRSRRPTPDSVVILARPLENARPPTTQSPSTREWVAMRFCVKAGRSNLAALTQESCQRTTFLVLRAAGFDGFSGEGLIVSGKGVHSRRNSLKPLATLPVWYASRC